jgi:2-methylcitrate dehydratase PrpD
VSGATALTDFVTGLQLEEVPEAPRRRLELLLADLAAVCVSGRPAPASRIAVEYAQAVHPGDQATTLLDGARVGALGAAWANGVLANVLDFDDGHRLTKGHPGAMVIPGALAAAQLADAGVEELLAAIAVGYEVAIRAGIALHDRDDGYHASGAWGAIGVAAASARLLGLDAQATVHALGLAEYHAPIALIMRSVAEPAMTKDACAWGAWLGLSSALLASRGFTSVPPQVLDAAQLDDLGTAWRVEEVYVKPYPCCRWSQGAIRAAGEAAGVRALVADEVQRVVVRTFAAADALAKVAPTSTEEAQYNLVWPVATVLARGDFGVPDVLGPWDDPATAALADRTEVQVDAELTAAFPARRLAAVTVQLRSGETLAAGPLEAHGEPDDPEWSHVVAAKVTRAIDPTRDLSPPPAGRRLRDLGAGELLHLLCAPVLATADA